MDCLTDVFLIVYGQQPRAMTLKDELDQPVFRWICCHNKTKEHHRADSLKIQQLKFCLSGTKSLEV